MLNSILVGLLIGWILGLFGFDTLVINGSHELFNMTITHTGYYFVWVLVGFLFGFMNLFKRSN